MDDVNIYIEIRIRGLRAKKGYYSYVLEALDCDGYPREKDVKISYGMVEDATETKLTLAALIEALKRFKKPCSIRVNTECGGFLNALSEGWVRSWKKNGWRNAKGEPVKNAELWQEFTELASNHLYSCERGAHKYRGLLQWEMKRMEREDR